MRELGAESKEKRGVKNEWMEISNKNSILQLVDECKYAKVSSARTNLQALLYTKHREIRCRVFGCAFPGERKSNGFLSRFHGAVPTKRSSLSWEIRRLLVRQSRQELTGLLLWTSQGYG